MANTKKFSIIIASVTVITLFIIGSTDSTTSKIYPRATVNKSHHLIVGRREFNDRLDYQEFIVKNSQTLRVVTVEKTFNASRNSYITQIQALDQKTNGNGAYASLLKNGPGFNNVTLKFKSQRGHGINFKVLIYSRY